jgi:glutathione S-transferase
MELYLKAGPQGTSVGDCPFAHYVRCVLHFKGLECKVLPCTAETKPAWLINEYSGKMPCLRIDGLTITESGEIVKYIEKTYTEPSLTVPNLNEAMQIQANMFLPMAKFLKSKEFDEGKENDLITELTKLNEHFGKTKYLAGDSLSLADYSLGPKLYHLDIAVDNFYPDTRKKIKNTCENLENYMTLIFEDSSFEATKYPHDVVIWGWTNARK